MRVHNNRWYEKLEKTPPTDASTILTTLTRFIGGFRVEYKISADRLPFLTLLIQRILFPRLWYAAHQNINKRLRCVPSQSNLYIFDDRKIVTSKEGRDIAEKDRKFRKQVEWMRTLTQRQLGIPDAVYCVPPYTFMPLPQLVSICMHSIAWISKKRKNGMPLQQ
jgi:hypothetical protein